MKKPITFLLVVLLLFPQFKLARPEQAGITATLLIALASGVASELGSIIVQELFDKSSGSTNYQQVINEFEKYLSQSKIYDEKEKVITILDGFRTTYPVWRNKSDTVKIIGFLEKNIPILAGTLDRLSDPDISNNALRIYTLTANIRAVALQDYYSLEQDSSIIYTMTTDVKSFMSHVCGVADGAVDTRLNQFSNVEDVNPDICIKACEAYIGVDNPNACGMHLCAKCYGWKYTDGSFTYQRMNTCGGTLGLDVVSHKKDVENHRKVRLGTVKKSLKETYYWTVAVTEQWQDLLKTLNVDSGNIPPTCSLKNKL